MAANGGGAASGTVLQSATRALHALDALGRRPDGATAKALSGDLGLSLGATYHLLNTLVAVGYAVQDPIDRHFRLGPRVPHLHQAFLDGLRSPPGALALLGVLRDATAETVYLGRLHGQDAVALACLEGALAGAVPAGYVGLGGPAHATALGQAILAALPPPLLERYLAVADLSAKDPFAGGNAPTLRRELVRIREQGYAVDRGDRSNGLAGCLAAAVWRADAAVPDAIAVIAPRARFLRAEATLRSAVTAVAQAASALGKAVETDGDSPPEDAAAVALAEAMAATRPPRLPTKRSRSSPDTSPDESPSTV